MTDIQSPSKILAYFSSHNQSLFDKKYLWFRQWLDTHCGMRLSTLNVFSKGEHFVQEAYKIPLSFFKGEKKTCFKRKMLFQMDWDLNPKWNTFFSFARGLWCIKRMDVGSKKKFKLSDPQTWHQYQREF